MKWNELRKVFLRYKVPLFYLLIILLTTLAYYQTIGHDFVNFDDPLQLTKNEHVLRGLTWENLIWAFSLESQCSPLTFLTYTLCNSICGLNPHAFHGMSLVLHIINCLLLFTLLKKMTGEFWKSATVGLLFALHPMNVESVAWVAELNNVLSGLFFMMTLLTYNLYTERPNLRRYFLVLLSFALGLLSKPAIMTLPFILLLLDLWPLKRIQVKKGGVNKRWWGIDISGIPLSRLIMEKIPLLMLSCMSLTVNLISAENRMGLYGSGFRPLSLRCSNAIVSYVKYLGKLFWPHDLFVNYPYPSMIPWWHVITAGLVLVSLTLLVFRLIVRYPYYLVGWLWFLGGLVPFLGIFQAGTWPEMADRYAYLTYIGIFIALSWGIPDLLIKWKNHRIIMALGTSTLILVLTALTWVQVGYWKDSITLFNHVIAMTKKTSMNSDNYALAIAYNNLGQALYEKGDFQSAVSYYTEAIRIAPDYEKPHYGLGLVLAEGGHNRDAVEQFRECIRINPKNENASNRLGNVMMAMGNYDEAIHYYIETLNKNSHLPGVYYNLGHAYSQKGNFSKAIEYYNEAIRLKPDFAEAQVYLNKAKTAKRNSEAFVLKIKDNIRSEPGNPELHNRLGDLFRQQGAYDDSIEEYQKALSIQPGSTRAMYGLVFVYSEREEYSKALGFLLKIQQLQPDNPDIYYNIACLYSKQNMVDESIRWLKQSLEKGFHDWDLIRNDPDLRNFRNTAFGNELMKNH